MSKQSMPAVKEMEQRQFIDHGSETAILMAAGLGSRLRPLTLTTPKPLLRVGDRPMIETVLDGLAARGVSRLVVVTGYLAEQFSYLPEKYPGLTLVKNGEFETVNNISSIRAVCDILRAAPGPCFICEADLYLADPGILQADLTQSCYFGKMVPGPTDDWCFTQDAQGRITRVKKGGMDVYNMVGISWFLPEDAHTLAETIDEAYRAPGYEDLFWDEVVDKNLGRLPLTIHEITDGQLVEIDTPQELEAVNRSISK